MIIPRGTEIRLNAQGQLSIKTPGNLVIQNSGNYSEIESTNGSIRIEADVNVEAVNVRAGQACYVQGTLTAWRVTAKKIALEERAKAYIMLQESEQLELGRGSRLVGNFANEKEVYLLLGKFTPQLKELPAAVDMHATTALGEPPRPHSRIESAQRPDSELPEPLRKALSILEHEIRRPDLDPQSSEALREVVFALRERNLLRARSIYRDAFSELTVPSDMLKSAYELLESYFKTQ